MGIYLVWRCGDLHPGTLRFLDRNFLCTRSKPGKQYYKSHYGTRRLLLLIVIFEYSCSGPGACGSRVSMWHQFLLILLALPGWWSVNDDLEIIE